jgi:hypothetical protein
MTLEHWLVAGKPLVRRWGVQWRPPFVDAFLSAGFNLHHARHHHTPAAAVMNAVVQGSPPPASSSVDSYGRLKAIIAGINP